ncbi:low molecular weight phosphatase family protein [Halococcus saccharolyticus]|uniref:Protein-tyrosine phosphatase, low molecular weight n=1 Tax=Halococcus saccharolyticus DSM 5350 TaxID=1227455 RepID=M0MGS6_9EURY|nr:low molecular weight phosphatase family protein [Halococcus saccharolyticus]EMA44932.1 protein-tyrosine phosphatase, low molecular weight [Halococcus saccharolyticus DSM 5350]
MSTTTDSTDTIRLAFMCVQNAGRSQMATAFAEYERQRRDLDDAVEILTGGTRPADHVHEGVIEVMREEGFDLSERTPREITSEELQSCDYVATMGCSTLEIDKEDSTVDIRDWNLLDPHGEDIDTVRSIRDDIHQRVVDLFDELSDDSQLSTTTN